MFPKRKSRKHWRSLVRSCSEPPFDKKTVTASTFRYGAMHVQHQRPPLLDYLAVDELDYSGEELARLLSISGRGVSDCRDRGQKMLDKPEIIGQYLA